MKRTTAFGLLITFILASCLAAGVYYLAMIFLKRRPTEATTVVMPEAEQAPPIPPIIPEWIRTEETKKIWVPLTGAAYPGNDINEPFDDTLKSCAARCENATGCVAATFSQDTNRCSLKTKLGKPVVNGNVTVLVPYTPPYPPPQKPTDSGELACYTSGEDHLLCSALCAVHGDCKVVEEHDRKSDIWSYGGCCLKSS